MKVRILFVLLIFMLCMTVLAQDEPDTSSPDASGTVFVETGTPFDAIINDALAGLAMLVYLPSTVGFVTILTSLTKRFVEQVSANVIALIWMILFWALYMGLRQFNIDISVYDQLLNNVTMLGYTLLAMSGTQVLSGWWYQQNKAAGVPIVGYSKSTQSTPPAPPRD